MSKPELEFFAANNIEWIPVAGNVPGLYERILARDSKCGAATRMLLCNPGTDTSANGIVVHDFWEEVYILEGAIYDIPLGKNFIAGMYACLPPVSMRSKILDKINQHAGLLKRTIRWCGDFVSWLSKVVCFTNALYFCAAMIMLTALVQGGISLVAWIVHPRFLYASLARAVLPLVSRIDESAPPLKTSAQSSGVT